MGEHAHVRAGRGRPARAAFTLVEMLIIVGVIGVLGALLVPGLLSAQRRAQTVGCASNMRQIGKAMAMYADDNENWPDGNYGVWCALIADQVESLGVADDASESILCCPANATHNVGKWPRKAGYGLKKTMYRCDLVINNYVSGGGWEYKGVKPAALRRPDRAILVLDGTVKQTVQPVV